MDRKNGGIAAKTRIWDSGGDGKRISKLGQEAKPSPTKNIVRFVQTLIFKLFSYNFRFFSEGTG